MDPTEAAASSSLPLPEENLFRLDASTGAELKQGDALTTRALELDLQIRSIFMDLCTQGNRCPMPRALELHIQDMCDTSGRDVAAGHTFASAWRQCFWKPKADQKARLAHMLFDTRELPSPELSFSQEIDATFLPPARPAHLGSRSRTIQIDLTVGYESQSPTRTSDLLDTSKVEFLNDDCLGDDFKLLRGPLFPIMTGQWPRKSGGTQYCAEVQSARIGATIVNYMHKIFESAGYREATAVDTHHWSLTIDADSIFLHVHWRFETENGGFGMKTVARAFADDRRHGKYSWQCPSYTGVC